MASSAEYLNASNFAKTIISHTSTKTKPKRMPAVKRLSLIETPMVNNVEINRIDPMRAINFVGLIMSKSGFKPLGCNIDFADDTGLKKKRGLYLWAESYEDAIFSFEAFQFLIEIAIFQRSAGAQ